MPPRFRSLRLLTALVVALPLAAGCTQVLLTSAYLIKGMGVAPEFKDLKGKTTAVVCRPLVELQYSSSGAAQQLARQTASLMKQKGSRIEIVSPQKVEQWTDEHEWEEFTEVGKALKSDYVVGLELEEFSLYQGQTIYQGRARVRVVVHDMKRDGATVYEKSLPQIVFPPNAGIPTSEKPEDQFRREFIALVAERIGRSFYEYDPRDDMALDSRALD